MLFISHSTDDKTDALDLQRRLRNRGYVCEQHFLDSDQRSGIKLGEKWEKVIYDNLRDCRVLLVLCSPNWEKSKWCFAELASAKMSGKQIFPIVLKDCDRKALIEYQAVFINDPDPVKREERFERLFNDLEAKGFGPRDWLPWPNPELKDANGQIDACPFPGLPAFDERYAAVYFGREREKLKLLEKLKRMRTHGEPRLLMIVGGSGSGKSSLLLAGVLPNLKHSTRSDEWRCRGAGTRHSPSTATVSGRDARLIRR
jgi:TIR domain